MKLHGTLILDEDGDIALRMQLSPQNPNLEDVPLKELLEELEGKRVSIDIVSLTSTWEGIDP